MKAVCLSVAVIALAGCAIGDDDEVAQTSPTAAKTRVLVYFVRDEHLGAAAREVTQTSAVGAAALRELLAGPSAEDRAAGLVSSVPSGTRSNAFTVDDGIATVDLSRAFESGGGSASMRLRVAQVVYTLTQFPAVKRVRFRIDGRPVDAVGGEGVVVEPPVGRRAFEDETPAVLVEYPTPGAVVRSPLNVRGTANTFEATLNLRLLDPSGKVLYDNFTTATSGSGSRGTFEQDVEFRLPKDGPGTLVAYERSAVDGSETNVVRIPVELRR